MKQEYREYAVKKYVRARTAEEAILLAEKEPAIEVYEMKDKPESSNETARTTYAVGFWNGT